MDKATFETLPDYADVVRQWTSRRRRHRIVRVVAASVLAYFAYSAYLIAANTAQPQNPLSLDHLRDDFATCAALQRVPVTSDEQRSYNKRWVDGTKPVLIRNATVWTGEPLPKANEEDLKTGEGFDWIKADVLVDRGLIVEVADAISLRSLPPNCEIFEANGRQLTTGIVDMHTHAGLASLGNLQDDTNELSSDITPYVRSLDGLDPLHPEIQWIKSGGVTTSLLLPGSGNNIGGEAFVIKFAVGTPGGRTNISQVDMLADPDHTWRYMKMACGENAKSVYGRVGKQGPFSRLGETWEFRHALEQARNYVKAQDDWCTAAKTNDLKHMTTYLPQDLRWEALGAVLRGQVRVNTHCYTIPDLESYVRLTNEFEFHLSAFHHAHQTYLVPEVLKDAWGGPPAIALFADNMYYKVEAYTASEQAGKIAYESGITPVYVSDNPVSNAQHVVFEAAKAYTFGLPYHAALQSVTSAPAEILGLGDRIGKIKAGFDADIVVWDSDPLSVGAAPVQVWIDGAAQFENPFELKKPILGPMKPDPSLTSTKTKKEIQGNVIFTNVSKVLLAGQVESFDKQNLATVVVSDGSILCVGACHEEIESSKTRNAPVINLQNGYLAPAFVAVGSSLGFVEIDAESDTHNGPFSSWSRGVDGLALSGKQLAAAFDHGTTKAISAPSTGSIDAKGVSVGFATGAKHALEKDAVWNTDVAVHYTFTLGAKSDDTPSISSAIGDLRKKLLSAIASIKKNETISDEDQYTEQAYLRKVIDGTLSLVLSVHSADTIAAIIRLKQDVEKSILSTDKSNSELKIVILGGAESYLVAPELASSGIPVVLAPLLPHAISWDQRRSLTGAPLTNGTAIDILLDAGVLVAIGVEEIWQTRELGLMAGWARANGGDRLSEEEALALVGKNVYQALNIDKSLDNGGDEWVVWEGSPLEIGSKIRAIGSMGRTSVWI